MLTRILLHEDTVTMTIAKIEIAAKVNVGH